MSLEPPTEPHVEEYDPEIEIKAFELYERKIREWGWETTQQYEQEEIPYDPSYWERELLEEMQHRRFMEAHDFEGEL